MLGGSALRRSLGRARRVPAVVWAATAAFTLALAVYSVLVPLYEAPDETGHIDLVAHLAGGGDYPAYDARRIDTRIDQACAPYIATIYRCPGDRPLESIPGVRHLVLHAASEAPPKGDRPTFPELTGSPQPSLHNQLPQHPPLYYELMGGVLRVVRFVVPGDMPFGLEVALLRAFNVLLVAPLPLLAWAAARRLGIGSRAAGVAALLPLAVPQLTHIGSTVNNDNLLIALGAAITVLAAGVVGGDRRWATAGALALATGAALLTKSSAVAFVAMVALAYVVGWVRAGGPVLRGERLAIVARAGAVGFGVAALAGWWYLGNKLDHGTFVPSIDTEILERREPPPGFEARPSQWIEVFAAYFPARFWGWFGWFSVRATFRLLVGASVAAVALLVVGIAAPRRRGTGEGRRPRRLDLALLLVPGLVLLALVVGRGWSLYATSGAFPFLQGRYLFPGLVAGAVVAACGADRIFGRGAGPAVLLWAGVMHADAVRAILKGYWDGQGDGLVGRLRSVVAWSPWPGELLGMGALVAVAAGGLLVAAVTLGARRDRPQVEADAA